MKWLENSCRVLNSVVLVNASQKPFPHLCCADRRDCVLFEGQQNLGLPVTDRIHLLQLSQGNAFISRQKVTFLPMPLRSMENDTLLGDSHVHPGTLHGTGVAGPPRVTLLRVNSEVGESAWTH